MKVLRLRLDALLKEAGMNRSAFSKKAGISYPVVDRYYKTQCTNMIPPSSCKSA